MDTPFLVLALLTVIIVVVLAGSVADSRVRRTGRQVARLEDKIDLILDHLGISHTDPEMEQVVALLREGKKIPAIKSYREITGADLLHAKNAVERMERDL
ncbi:hypothetical protein GCM10009730_20820 [Streptomyces albidochromogenes]|uniref:hypothetical protein n=1 Tax=Streptomyces albidochromogenes TaxID=329524 RepID=UPI00110FEC4E|nr:hypothetical protein [Streptomyces albidochromogenes]